MRTWLLSVALLSCTIAAACGDNYDGVDTGELARRAYVVSLMSDELTVIDLDDLSVVARIATGGIANHMAEVSPDRRKVYVSSPGTNEVIVVDAVALKRVGAIAVGHHPTHMNVSRDGRYLAVVNEEDNTVSFIAPDDDHEVARVGGFTTPHFVRYAHDGRTAYVANIGGHHLNVVDLDRLEITGSVVLDGFTETTPAPFESGFADAQIAPDGLLYAAHAGTGKVLVYDTVARAKVSEIRVGTTPWVAFAEHPFKDVALRHLVPNFGDSTVSLIDGKARAVAATLEGDSQAYGVNVSPLAPDRAYVMNRIRGDIAVVDTRSGAIMRRIPVGGNTETAATSADGRWIVAGVSGADSVVVLDAATGAIARTIPNVGKYPWSVTIADGQNYCH